MAGPLPAWQLVAYDVFERHGRTWTALHIIRWFGSVHVVCAEGDVWMPSATEVVVLSSTQVDLRGTA